MGIFRNRRVHCPRSGHFFVTLFSKGQVSAPFELFVALIIMAFVVIIGTQMIVNVNRQTCLATVDKELTEFKLNMEKTVNDVASNSFTFSPQKCFNENKAIIKVESLANDKSCSAKCGIPSESCFTVLFYAPDVSNAYKEKCLNIPEYTSFLGDTPSCPVTDELAGYDAIDPRDGFGIGQYILRNVSEAGATYPKICVYYKAT